MRSVIGFVPSTDLERSRAFYEGVLGLEVEEISPYALVLRSGGTMIRVAQVQELTPQPFTILGWEVSDIAHEIRHLTTSGVTFTRYDGIDQDELAIWHTPDGDQIAWFPDPDGNTLSLTQFARP